MHIRCRAIAFIHKRHSRQEDSLEAKNVLVITVPGHATGVGAYEDETAEDLFRAPALPSRLS